MTVRRSRPSLRAKLTISNREQPQDLTFCYLHMTQQDLDILDTIGTSDYITGDLSDSGKTASGW